MGTGAPVFLPAPSAEAGRAAQRPAADGRIARDGSMLLRVPAGGAVVEAFYLARTPVTHAAFARFCAQTGRPRPRYYGERFRFDHAPVVGVSWADASAYAAWAGLRLPTEQEWERAATLGWRPAVALAAVAWFRDNSDGRPHAVGTLAADVLGFHDLLGNVWEWTADWYDDERVYRVVRGGSWRTVADDVRPAHRDWNPPVERMDCIGFRCAWSPPAPRGARAGARS